MTPRDIITGDVSAGQAGIELEPGASYLRGAELVTITAVSGDAIAWVAGTEPQQTTRAAFLGRFVARIPVPTAPAPRLIDQIETVALSRSIEPATRLAMINAMLVAGREVEPQDLDRFAALMKALRQGNEPTKA